MVLKQLKSTIKTRKTENLENKSYPISFFNLGKMCRNFLKVIFNKSVYLNAFYRGA